MTDDLLVNIHWADKMKKKNFGEEFNSRIYLNIFVKL